MNILPEKICVACLKLLVMPIIIPNYNFIKYQDNGFPLENKETLKQRVKQHDRHTI